MDSFKIFIESIGKFFLIFFLEWQEHDGHGTGALASNLDLRVYCRIWKGEPGGSEELSSAETLQLSSLYLP